MSEPSPGEKSEFKRALSNLGEAQYKVESLEEQKLSLTINGKITPVVLKTRHVAIHDGFVWFTTVDGSPYGVRCDKVESFLIAQM